MAFKQKFIDLTFSLGTGEFGDGDGNTQKVKGLRTSAKILKAGPPAMSTLQLSVFGLKIDTMNKLSSLGMAIILQKRNTVLVEAYEDGQTPSTVFFGTIVNAWFDGQSSPETVFRLEANAGLYESVTTVPSVSFPGNTDVSVIFQKLADQMGVKFENNGVSVQLSSPSYTGSPRTQASQAATAAGIEWVLDDKTLAIWPRNQFRKGDTPVISADTGMVGYPSYVSTGIRIQTIYNPNILFGGQVKVEKSILDPANNTWNVFRIDHDLEAMMPNGKWFSTVDCYNPAFPAPIALG